MVNEDKWAVENKDLVGPYTIIVLFAALLLWLKVLGEVCTFFYGLK